MSMVKSFSANKVVNKNNKNPTNFIEGLGDWIFIIFNF